MSLLQYFFAFLAGTLTTLSPCVLPVLPLVLVSSLKAGRRGPLFFVGGLLVTFVGLTWVLSSFGSVAGLDRDWIRKASAVVLVVSGVLFLSEKAQAFVSGAFAPLVTRMSRTSVAWSAPANSPWEHGRQFLLGFLTGVIWTPCSGPSLGVAVSLAAERDSALSALPLLAVFGLGAALPMLAVAYGSASVTRRLRSGSLRWMGALKSVVGVAIVITGMALLSGLDKRMEAQLVRWSPEWLSELTTRF